MRYGASMRRLLALPLLLAPLPAMAQQEDAQLWLQTNASTEVAKGTRVTVEAIGRFSDSAGGFSHDELGGMATFQVAKGVEVSFGYRHVNDYVQGVARPNEERLRQMIVAQLGGGFAGRLRFEQRFQASGTETAFRLRPQLRYTRKLGEKGLQLFATQEHFFNFNTTAWGVRSGHERMRNAVGLSIPLMTNLRGEFGYLNQYRFGKSGARDQMDHAATFTLTFTLDGVLSGHHGDAD